MTCWVSQWIDRWWHLKPKEGCSRRCNSPCWNDSPSRWPRPWVQRAESSSLACFTLNPSTLPDSTRLTLFLLLPEFLATHWRRQPSCDLHSSYFPSETSSLEELNLWKGWSMGSWTRFFPLCSQHSCSSQLPHLYFNRASVTLQLQLSPTSHSGLAQEQGFMAPNQDSFRKLHWIWIVSWPHPDN